MSTILTIFILSVIAIFDLSRKSRLHIDAFRIVLALYAVVYVLIPELLPFSYASEPYPDGMPWPPRLVSLAGLVALIFGYYLSAGLPILKPAREIRSTEKSEYRFVFIVLLLSIGALYIYASSFGGFLSALSYGASFRFAGSKEVEVNAGSAVALYFISMANIVFVMSQYKLYQDSKYKKRYVVLLISAATALLAYGIILGGRGVMFNALLLALFIHFNVRGFKITVRKLIAVGIVFVVGLLFVVYGKKAIGATASVFRGEEISTAFESIESKETEQIYGRIIVEFSHPIKSIGVAMDSDMDINMMRHFIVAPLHLLPTRMLGLSGDKPYRITEMNTELLTGDTKGGIPPGLVASLWYGGGIVGVLSGLLIFGAFIGWLQRQCYRIVEVFPSAMPIILYMFFLSISIIFNGDPSVTLKHMFHFFVFLALLIAYYYSRRIRIYSRQTSQTGKELPSEN